MDDINVGSKINVKIVKDPTSAGAKKTLRRLMNKSEAMKTENRRLKRVRQSHYAPRNRGGRLYGGQLIKQHPVRVVTGEQETIVASPDVLRELRSVQRFIEVTPA